MYIGVILYAIDQASFPEDTCTETQIGKMFYRLLMADFGVEVVISLVLPSFYALAVSVWTSCKSA